LEEATEHIPNVYLLLVALGCWWVACSSFRCCSPLAAGSCSRIDSTCSYIITHVPRFFITRATVSLLLLLLICHSISHHIFC
jgi:hypothetical protein